MTRSTLSTLNRAQATAKTLRIAELVELNFPSGSIRITTAAMNVSYNGNTYASTPVLLGHEPFIEPSILKASRTILHLSGLDSGLLSKLLTDNYHYSLVNVWIGFFDQNWVLVDAPYQIADSLIMSSGQIQMNPQAGVIDLACEGYEIFGDRDAAALATPQAQRLRYAGDSGMDRCKTILSGEVKWGGVLSRVSDPGG